MVFEDAHWIDPTSRELLDLMIERVRSLPVLLIVTFRPEFEPLWTGEEQVRALALNRLDRYDRTILAQQIAGGKALPDEVVTQIVERTDGIPLFVEELTKSVLESGLLRQETDRYVFDGTLPPLTVPTTLNASLLARLDRLGPVRHVAQIGAAIGRQFSYALLHAVCRLPEGELQAALIRLVASELVLQRGVPPDAVYRFKHALVQDTAHGSLLRDARQRLHAQIAEAFESTYPEIVESQPELLAQHYAEAGLVEKSITYWGKAGHSSVARSAMAEAAAQFQKGLDQLALLPDAPRRQRQELEFYSALAAIYQVLIATAADETGYAFARARELWERLGSPPEFVQLLYGQSRFHLYCGELDLAQRVAEELLRFGNERNASDALVLGHNASGVNLMIVGQFAASRSHLEEALALYHLVPRRSLVLESEFHPHVNSLVYLGMSLCCLGFPDQAVERCNAARAESRRLAHLPSLAVSLAIGARVMSLLGDDATLIEWTNELVTVAAERGFLSWSAMTTIYCGLITVKNGDVTEGLRLLRRGLDAFRSTGMKGMKVLVPYFTALLATACEIAGRIEEASSLLDDALQLVDRTEERWFAAELNRLKGQLLLRTRQPEAAAQLYRKALSTAREQQAKLWELRAAASLARLRRDQGRRAEARDLLSPVYGWFTEGFDTSDLKEAKALLDELGG
jgi:predicted ATPase